MSQTSKYPATKGNTSNFYGIQCGIHYTKVNFKALLENSGAERIII